MRKLLWLAISGALAVPAQAYDKIPQQDGFSGYLFLGGSANSMETNTVASIGDNDVGAERIDSINDSPDSEDYSGIVPAFGLSYTFAGSRTQIFGGTEQEDFLTQDSSIGIGIRQGLGGLGNLRASLLASTGSEVWEDPYLENADRRATDRDSGGMRLGWEHIFESDFAVTLTSRSIELDDEFSGASQPLTPAQRALLEREGDQNKVDFSYRWEPSPDHVLIPTLSYVDHDLDGEAMAMDGYQFELNYAYLGMRNWEFIVNLLAGSLESDETNPLYGETQDLDRLGASVAATYKEPFGLQDWKASATLSYGEEDSNIDFYDSSLQSLVIGMMYTF